MSDPQDPSRSDDASSAVPFGSTEDEPVDERADELREQGIMPDLESVREDLRDEGDAVPTP
jgi:hypothetical protein